MHVIIHIFGHWILFSHSVLYKIALIHFYWHVVVHFMRGFSHRILTRNFVNTNSRACARSQQVPAATASKFSRQIALHLCFFGHQRWSLFNCSYVLCNHSQAACRVGHRQLHGTRARRQSAASFYTELRVFFSGIQSPIVSSRHPSP